MDNHINQSFFNQVNTHPDILLTVYLGYVWDFIKICIDTTEKKTRTTT